MGFDTQDKEIVRLLTKLKETDGKYPPDLLVARRQSYLKQMGEISMGLGAGLKIKNALNGIKGPALSSTTSTVLESALVVAIVAETGTVAYFYRDQLAGIVKKISKETHVQEVTSVPTPTESEIQGVAPSAAVASLLPSVTVSISPTEPEIASTPIPALVEGGVTNTSNTVIANSTPAPNGNNGHHYGQTPKPERTKEPKNGGNPRDNSKPTKAK